MALLQTYIDIQADSDVIWRLLTGLSDYERWNPFIRHARGKVAPGERLLVEPVLPGRKRPNRFEPVIHRFEEGRAFSWVGTVGPSWLAAGEHIFELQPLEGGGTRLIHDEEFRGLLAPLAMLFVGEKTREGFVWMNEALKREAEALASR